MTGRFGANGWYISATTLTWIAIGNPAPSTSGCATLTVPETKGTTYRCSAANSLGSAHDTVTIKEDTVAPTVTIRRPANGATYRLHEIVVASYTCRDATSGVASCTGNVADGADLPTSTTGPHTITVGGTDNAGNIATESVGYTVAK